jgi:E3 ubiquitin-protein ligase TRIP12
MSALDVEEREELILEAFSIRSNYAYPGSQTPMANLVKRLQESLTRMETYEVVSASPGSMDGGSFFVPC